MPSGGIVEIDRADADNGVAILDASACALAASSSSSSEKENVVTQSQDNDKEEESVHDNDNDEEPPPAAHVSPMPPQKKKASLVTPRSIRKHDDGGGTTSSKSKSKKKKGNSSSSNSDGSPATPPPSNASDPSASSIAVATPGEDSAKKDKKSQQRASSKPSTTLHSFFSKVDPSAKKKKSTGGGVKKTSGGEKTKKASSTAATTANKTKGGASKKPTSEEPCSTKVIKKPTTEEPRSAKVTKKSTKETTNNDKVKKAAPPQKKTQKKTAGEDAKKNPAGSGVTTNPPSERSTKIMPPHVNAPKVVPGPPSSQQQDAEELDDSPMYALAVASRKLHAGGRRRGGSAGGRRKREDDAVATNAAAAAAVVAEDASKDREEEVVVQMVQVVDVGEVPEKSGDASEDGNVPADSSHGAEGEESNDSNMVVEVADPVQLERETAMDVVDVEAVVETPLAGDSIAKRASDDVIDVDCEEEQALTPEETANDLENIDEDDEDDDDATVALEENAVEESNAPNDVGVEEDSGVPTEINQPQNTNDNSTDKEEQPTEDDDNVVVVNATQKSVLEEIPTEDNAKESLSNKASNDEVVVVTASQRTTKSKKRGVKKSLPKPSKKKPAAAASSNKKSAKKKKSPAAAAAPEKTKGISPIAASLKKLAACPPKKKSKVSPPAEAKKQQVSPSAAATTSSTACAESKMDNDAAAAPSTKPTAAANKAENASAVAATTTAIPTTSTPNLSKENASRLRHYTTLREKYVTRAMELGERPSSEDFEEESLSMEEEGSELEKGSVDVGEDGDFPDALLTHLLLMVQGRPLPLSALAKQALDELSQFTTDARPLTIESISSKIKLLAQRKSYLSGKPPAPSEKSTPISKLDCFENTEECYMWRWELSSIELLPQKEATKVKKARTMRKKLQSHYKSIINLIAAIDKAVTWVQNSTSKTSTAAAGDKLIAKVSDMEEKVLKFEREEETARLLKEAKLHKQKSKASTQAEKETEKKRKEEEKERKKVSAAKEREEAKRKKNEEKEQEKLKKKQELEEKENKRKARMMSFFSKGDAKKKKQKVSGSALSKDVAKENVPSFDGDAFRKLIDSREEHVSNPFAKLSSRSKASRRRKTRNVRVSVFVTVVPENAFAPQPYDEERIITVPNRYKFLGFHEDVHPPYRGTWSKRSSIVTGRTPMKKDTKYLDYENDSEDEWEEGDDDEGEDLQDGDDGVEEEEDMQNEEDNDGFIAADDDLGLEEDDDETRELRKKNLSEAKSSLAKRSHFKACVVAPRMGGLSHEGLEGDMQCVIEGFSPQDAMDALSGHIGCVITPDVSICLDAFPPSDSTKDNHPTKKDASGKSSTAQNKEMSVEAQKIMAQFVHNCMLKSKENVVTELLKAHPTVTSSRAQAMRELDVIAEKRRLVNGGGVLWEVKASHLKKLGLKKKDLKKPPKEASPSKASDGGDKKSKEKKDPNAPKKNLSAYILYSNATRSDVRVANPDAQFGDIARLLSANFKSLTSEERAPWDEKATSDKARYQKEMADYSATNATVSSDKKAESISPKVTNSSQDKPSSAKKRKKPVVSAASANLFAAFLGKSKKPKIA